MTIGDIWNDRSIDKPALSLKELQVQTVQLSKVKLAPAMGNVPKIPRGALVHLGLVTALWGHLPEGWECELSDQT